MFEGKSFDSKKLSEPKYESGDLKRFDNFAKEVSRVLGISASELGWEDMILWNSVKKGIGSGAEVEIRKYNVSIDVPALSEAQEKFYDYLKSLAQKEKAGVA